MLKKILAQHRYLLTIIACSLIAACNGGGGSDSTTGSPSRLPLTLIKPIPPAGNEPDNESTSYVPLSWTDDLPATQYTLVDGTLVTRVGGRVRDRHAREGFVDNYNQFPAHYFEKRTHEIILYDTVDPNSVDKINPDRILTVVVRPQYWMFDVNFRHGYHGSVSDPNGYVDNSNMKTLDPYNVNVLLQGKDITTPLNFNALGYDILNKEGVVFGSTASGSPDFDPCGGVYSGLEQSCRYFPDGRFVMVKEIRQMANQGYRKLKAGDLIEFEIGPFLAGEKSHTNINNIANRWNYYSDTMLYKVGSLGMVPWMRQGGTDPAIALQSIEMPKEARLGGDMTLHENTAFNAGAEKLLMQAGTNIADYHIQPWTEGRRLFHVSYLTGTHTEINNPIFRELFGKEGVGWTQTGPTYDDIEINIPKAGPLFSQTRCLDCHSSNGRSSPKLNGGINNTLSNMGVFIGASDEQGKQIPHPQFGTRLQQGWGRDKSSERLSPEKFKDYDAREATLSVTYTPETHTYPDGQPYTLHRPSYTLTAPNGEVLPLPSRLSVRAAPQVVGMGLLEAIDEASLEALVLTQQGTSTPGKLQVVKDPSGTNRVGRFGWKGGSPTVEVQVAAALNTDMGVTTPLFPTHECALGAASGSVNSQCAEQDRLKPQPELSAEDVEKMSLYLRLLGVPSSRTFAESVTWPDPKVQGMQIKNSSELAVETTRVNDVQAGKALFAQAQCIACHVDTMKTGNKHRFHELRNQTIHPYSDLLLHDMGADLADQYVEGRAKGSEWRTAPLWGIGLLSTIDPNVRYLHDGRAATLEEAILWHGGQATTSRNLFMNYSATQRAQLIEFLKSL